MSAKVDGLLTTLRDDESYVVRGHVLRDIIRRLQALERRPTPAPTTRPQRATPSMPATKLCKITTDNADGTYDVAEWDADEDEGLGWTQEDVTIWEAPEVDFWDGAGEDKMVLCVCQRGTWYITLGYANLDPEA